MRRYAAIPFIAATVFTGAMAWVLASIDRAIRYAWSTETDRSQNG